MPFRRSSGVLLHATSLPGGFGIGDLGPAAFEFIDLLASAGQRLWQVLPLGPTGYGDSPYQCFSAFAGNPLLISIDRVVERGYLDALDLQDQPVFSSEIVDFGTVIEWKLPLLRKAFQAFRRAATSERGEFEEFCQ